MEQYMLPPVEGRYTNSPAQSVFISTPIREIQSEAFIEVVCACIIIFERYHPWFDNEDRRRQRQARQRVAHEDDRRLWVLEGAARVTSTASFLLIK